MIRFDIRDCCEEMLDSIKKEIRVMSNIPEHPNIAKYLGHSSQPGKEICIFMSFYMESLHSFIDKKRETQTNFSSEEILELAMQVRSILCSCLNRSDIARVSLLTHPPPTRGSLRHQGE